MIITLSQQAHGFPVEVLQFSRIFTFEHRRCSPFLAVMAVCLIDSAVETFEKQSVLATKNADP